MVSVVTDVVHFSYNSNNNKHANNSKIETSEMSFNRKVGAQKIIKKAIVLDGTFTLKERVKTLDDQKVELERACSTKERLKRAAITLLVVSVIIAGIAAIVLGGIPGAVVGGLGLIVFMMASDIYLAELNVGKPIPYNILFPLTMPIQLAYYMATYESKRAKNVEMSTIENSQIAKYVIQNKEKINDWLVERREETKIQISQENEKLNPNLTRARLEAITAEKVKLDDQFKKINEWITSLEESYKIAQTILPS